MKRNFFMWISIFLPISMAYGDNIAKEDQKLFYKSKLRPVLTENPKIVHKHWKTVQLLPHVEIIVEDTNYKACLLPSRWAQLNLDDEEYSLYLSVKEDLFSQYKEGKVDFIPYCSMHYGPSFIIIDK